MKYMVIQGEVIVAYGTCQPENLQAFAAPGQVAMFTSVWPSNHWWDAQTEELRERTSLDLQVSKTQIVADGIDKAVIHAVPPGTEVEIHDAFGSQMFGIFGDFEDVEIASTEPGPITVTLRHNRHEPWQITVSAT